MRKSLQHLFSKMDKNDVSEGFKVLKNIRGGNVTDPGGGNNGCENLNTCAGTNVDCANKGDCSKATNTGSSSCSNFICFD